MAKTLINGLGKGSYTLISSYTYARVCTVCRFIIPIFLHAGIIHLLLNMLGQWVLSGQVEREMGTAGFLILYFAAGIFGNVLGGNFALVGTPSVGASGAIVGTLAVLWVDLLAHWQIEYKPVQKVR